MSDSKFVCCGFGRTAKGVVCTKLQRIDADGDARGDVMLFPKAKLKTVSVGHVYTIEEPEPGVIHAGSARYVGAYKDVGKRREYEAAAEAFNLEERGRKLGDQRVIAGSVAEIRRAYSRLNASQRLPFELWLLNEVRK